MRSSTSVTRMCSIVPVDYPTDSLGQICFKFDLFIFPRCKYASVDFSNITSSSSSLAGFLLDDGNVFTNLHRHFRISFVNFLYRPHYRRNQNTFAFIDQYNEQYYMYRKTRAFLRCLEPLRLLLLLLLLLLPPPPPPPFLWWLVVVLRGGSQNDGKPSFGTSSRISYFVT
jgi:hypothetical protein